MFNRFFALTLSTALIFAGISSHVSASVMGTQHALSIEARELRIAEISTRLARDDVRAAMVELGVDPQQATLRVAALSEAELAELDGQLDTLPAGEGGLAIVGAVFVILLMLELFGVTDIFKNV